jgi:hypothetical protein
MIPTSQDFIPITIQARSGQNIATTLQLKRWSPAQRRARALRILGIGFLLTFVFVFLPIAHFILVPLGLVLTPIIAFKVSKLETVYPNQSLICPKCSQPVQFAFSFSLTLPLDTQCDACREVLKINSK